VFNEYANRFSELPEGEKIEVTFSLLLLLLPLLLLAVTVASKVVMVIVGGCWC